MVIVYKALLALKSDEDLQDSQTGKGLVTLVVVGLHLSFVQPEGKLRDQY